MFISLPQGGFKAEDPFVLNHPGTKGVYFEPCKLALNSRYLVTKAVDNVLYKWDISKMKTIQPVELNVKPKEACRKKSSTDFVLNQISTNLLAILDTCKCSSSGQNPAPGILRVVNLDTCRVILTVDTKRILAFGGMKRIEWVLDKILFTSWTLELQLEPGRTGLAFEYRMYVVKVCMYDIATEVCTVLKTMVQICDLPPTACGPQVIKFEYPIMSQLNEDSINDFFEEIDDEESDEEMNDGQQPPSNRILLCPRMFELYDLM